MNPKDLKLCIFRIVVERRKDDQQPSKRRKENTLGTGFFIWHKDRKALGVTCWHVINPPSLYWPPGKAMIEYSGVIYETTILRDKSYPDQDLAVLEVDIEHVKTVSLDLEWYRGDRIYALGFQEQDEIAGSVDIDGGISQTNPYVHPTFDDGMQQEVINFIGDGTQFRPGMSGAPILNIESRKVCAVATGYRKEKPGRQYRGYGIELKHLYSESWPEFKDLRPPKDFRPWQERTRVLLPIRNVLPHRNLNFTGREALLAALRAALTSGQPAALIQAISGLGGVGKTQIAVEYAYRYGKEYDVVWWVRAEEPTTLAADYAGLAHELHLPEQDAKEQAVIVAAVRRWLQHNAGSGYSSLITRASRWMCARISRKVRPGMCSLPPGTQLGAA